MGDTSQKKNMSRFYLTPKSKENKIVLCLKWLYLVIFMRMQHLFTIQMVILITVMQYYNIKYCNKMIYQI